MNVGTKERIASSAFKLLVTLHKPWKTLAALFVDARYTNLIISIPMSLNDVCSGKSVQLLCDDIRNLLAALHVQ